MRVEEWFEEKEAGREVFKKEILKKASDGAIVALSTMQEMVADHDERIFDSAILSRLEEIKTIITLLNKRIDLTHE